MKFGFVVPWGDATDVGDLAAAAEEAAVKPGQPTTASEAEAITPASNSKLPHVNVHEKGDHAHQDQVHDEAVKLRAQVSTIQHKAGKSAEAVAHELKAKKIVLITMGIVPML